METLKLKKINGKKENFIANLSKLTKVKLTELIDKEKSCDYYKVVKLKKEDIVKLISDLAKKESNKLETVKNKAKNKASYNNCVVETNRLMKEECNKLGYALKLFIDCKGINLINRPLSEKFTEYDRIKMTAIYEIIELARKDSKLYKFIESIKSIQTSKGKFVPYYVGQKLFNEKRELMLTKYVNSNIQEREIFTLEH
jgi:hypothetical protein